MAYRVDCNQGDAFTINSEDEQEVIEHLEDTPGRSTKWIRVTTRAE